VTKGIRDSGRFGSSHKIGNVSDIRDKNLKEIHEKPMNKKLVLKEFHFGLFVGEGAKLS
jgi:hypothetical protein